jgi:hypothetical protein
MHLGESFSIISGAAFVAKMAIAPALLVFFDSNSKNGAQIDMAEFRVSNKKTLSVAVSSTFKKLLFKQD